MKDVEKCQRSAIEKMGKNHIFTRKIRRKPNKLVTTFISNRFFFFFVKPFAI